MVLVDTLKEAIKIMSSKLSDADFMSQIVSSAESVVSHHIHVALGNLHNSTLFIVNTPYSRNGFD